MLATFRRFSLASFDVALGRSSNTVIWGLAMLSAVLCVIHLWDFLQVRFWRHDALYYIESYQYKLVTEGRWFNYGLFELLRLVPAWVAGVLAAIAMLIFVLQAGARAGLSRSFSMLLALAVMNIPLFRIQMEWPATLLPSYLLLAAAAMCAGRIRDYVYFPLFATLFMGTVSGFYFLLPMLFLGRLTFGRCLRLLVVWSASFVFGYVVANGVVYLLHGQGIELAQWRNPNLVSSWADLQENASRVWGSLRLHCRHLMRYGGQYWLLAAIVWSALQARPDRRGLCIVVGLSSALALYVISLSSGIVISARSAGVAWASVVLALFLVPTRHAVANLAGAVILFGLSCHFALATQAYSRWYLVVTDVLVDEMASLVVELPSKQDKITVVSNKAQWQSVIDDVQRRNDVRPFMTEPLSAPLYWRSLLVSQGVEARICVLTGEDACPRPIDTSTEVQVPPILISNLGYFALQPIGVGEWIVTVTPQ